MNNDTIKMFARYAIAIAISFATARGWISDAAGGTISQVAEQLLGLLAAVTPALYAAAKIDNSRKT
jgi:hypothetical protein